MEGGQEPTQGVLSSTRQHPLWEVLGLQKRTPCGCGCDPQGSQSPGEGVRGTKSHTGNPLKGPGSLCLVGTSRKASWRGGCLNWSPGLTGLTMRAEGEAFQAESATTTHCASPPLPTGPELPLTLVSSDSLQWGHPLSQGVGASASSKAGQPGGTVPDGLGSSLPVGSCSSSRLQCHC